MAKPKTKEQLLTAGNETFAQLQELIGKMSVPEQTATFLFEDRDKNLRDVLIHLYEWHQMMLEWYEVGCLNQGTPQTPAQEYKWNQLPLLNHEIWLKYQATSLAAVKELLLGSHRKVMAIIEELSDEELFEKGYYPWTKTTNLAAYFIPNTSGHYNWAMTKLKKHLRGYRGVSRL